MEVLDNETPPDSPAEEKKPRNTKRDFVFKFRLSFEGTHVEGSGKTKQKAKHDAAEVTHILCSNNVEATSGNSALRVVDCWLSFQTSYVSPTHFQKMIERLKPKYPKYFVAKETLDLEASYRL